jgi:hypothetical protein
MTSTRIAFILAALVLSGCGGGGGGTPSAATDPGQTTAPPAPSAPSTPATPVTVQGAAQKGPFLVGSTVLINRLDRLGHATTSTIVTEIKDSIGSFSFESDESGPVQIVAMGYYFSELTGQISGGVLTLKGLYQVNDGTKQVAHVNILTHLINDRVLKLIAPGGVDLASAIKQAENELVTALSSALVITNLNGFSALDLYDSTNAQNNSLGNAYLLALSTGFYKYAETKAKQFGTTTDGELTLALNRLSDDLEDDGRLTSGPFIGDFITAIRSLNPQTIANNLRSRSLVDYPQGLGVPDISRFLDVCAGAGDCPWSYGTPMPKVTEQGATAVYDGTIYVIGGAPFIAPAPPGDFHEPNEVDAYDSIKKEWTAKRGMPVSMLGPIAETIGDKIYVVAVRNFGYFPINGLYTYDPLMDQWAAKPPRPTDKVAIAAATVNGLLYVIDGTITINPNGTDYGPSTLETHSNLEIYDPATESWTAGAPLPITLDGGRTCVFSDQIYLFAGASGDDRSSREIFVYDTKSNTWTAKAPMPFARQGFECVVVDDHAYLVGGRAADWSFVDSVDRYDPFTETWSAPTRLPTPRSELSAAAVGRRIFTINGHKNIVVGGVNQATDVVEVLDTEKL